MDEDIKRLLSLPGKHDLSLKQVAEVLELSEKTVMLLIRRQLLEAKKHLGRGKGISTRHRISRAAVVRYLVNSSTGDRGAILAAIEEQCPQYLAAAKASGLTPSMAGNLNQLVKRSLKSAAPKGERWQPGQMALFDEFPAMAKA